MVRWAISRHDHTSRLLRLPSTIGAVAFLGRFRGRSGRSEQKHIGRDTRELRLGKW